MYEAAMHLTIVHDADVEVTGTDEFGELLPAPPSVYVRDSPDIPEDLSPMGSVWVVEQWLRPESEVPHEPLEAWLASPNTRPECGIVVLAYVPPNATVHASVLRGFVTQAVDLDRDLVVRLHV